ncbi:hypothetical protein [Stakelama tenebrarum]|nr:hypothetical protein [Sphingosinithalassobacter tenebrarum]
MTKRIGHATKRVVARFARVVRCVTIAVDQGIDQALSTRRLESL